MMARGDRRRRIVDAVGVGLAIAGAVAAIQAVAYAVSIDQVVDVDSFASGVARLQAGQSMYAPFQLAEPYSLAHSTGHVFVYPPAAMFLVYPFAATHATGAWLVLEVGVLFAGLLAVLHREGRLTPRWIAGALLATVPFQPFLQGVLVGNTALLVAGALGLGYAGSAGLWGGLAGLLKVTPAPLAFLDCRRSIAKAVVVGAVGLIASVIVFGASSWVDFGRAMSNAEPSCDQFVGLACAMAPTVGMAAAKTISLVLAATVALGALGARSRVGRLGFATASLAAATPEWGIGSQYLLQLYPLGLAVACRAAALLADRQAEREDERAVGRGWRRGDGLGDLHGERAGH